MDLMCCHCFCCPFRLNNPDSVKKRSKLVLPKPQISDTELEEVHTVTVMGINR